MFKSLLKPFLAASILLLLPNLSWSHEGHNHPVQPLTPEEVCSTENEDLCAHLHFSKRPNTLNEASFIFHVEGLEEIELSNLTLTLWMEMEGHAHGSAPVTVERVSLNKYKVTNAWFSMAGQWMVQARFTYDHQNYEIMIPVNIN